MAVNVKLGPEIRINALGLKTKLGGTLKVRQRTNKPLSVLGKIELYHIPGIPSMFRQ